jgi:hypothetical protein
VARFQSCKLLSSCASSEDRPITLLGDTTTRIEMDEAEIPQGGASASLITNDSPRLAAQLHTLSSTPLPVRTPASPIPIIQRSQSSPPYQTTERDDTSVSIQDLMPHLHRSAPSIVKTRSGSVLSRGFILKTDFYPSGEQGRTHLRLLLTRMQGARSILT